MVFGLPAIEQSDVHELEHTLPHPKRVASFGEGAMLQLPHLPRNQEANTCHKRTLGPAVTFTGTRD